MITVKKSFISIILLTGIWILMGVMGCDDNQYPDDIWDPNQVPGADPIITQILPADSAFAGADSVYIHGNNFSSNPDEILVYFNSKLAEIIQASENLLIVNPPALISNSVTVKVAVQGAYMFAEYPSYKLYPRLVEYGTFDNFEENVWGLALDTDENLYAGLAAKSIDKLIPPIGERIKTFIDLKPLGLGIVPKSLRVGPGGMIYYTDGGNPFVIKINLASGGFEGYTQLPGLVIDMDFDNDGNLFAGGGGTAVYLIAADLSVSTAKEYTDINIMALRVHNNYVYVAGKYIGEDTNIPSVGIWRNAILSATGDLGETELVLDWTTASGSDGNVTALTFDSSGLLYIGSDKDYGVMTLASDGALTSYYPKIILPPVAKLVWGNGNYLYLNYKGENKALYQMDTRISGAPYYGRQ